MLHPFLRLENQKNQLFFFELDLVLIKKLCYYVGSLQFKV